jgi:ABC-type transport system involved in multi-copper enzyme maturation permease subunit
MLWYKAWLETRSRFLISLIGMIAICSLWVFHLERDALDSTTSEYYNFVIYDSHSMLVMMWILAVTLIMMGGLLREQATGVSAFTLALPVSRTRLTTVRIGMGFLQAVILAIVPWGAIFSIACIFGKTHSISQAAFYLVLLLGGGLLFFAMAVLTSSIVGGEYTAPLVSYGTAIAIAVAFSSHSLRPYNPWLFMLGGKYLNPRTSLLVWPIPWLQAAGYIFLAALLLVISVRVVQRREF